MRKLITSIPNIKTKIQPTYRYILQRFLEPIRVGFSEIYRGGYPIIPRDYDFRNVTA